jgi:hypothetical protein
MPASGGAQSANVITGSGCAWTLVADVSWITINGSTTGAGTGNRTYVVAANTTSSTRTATLTVGGKTITVTQAGVPAPPTPGNFRIVP